MGSTPVVERWGDNQQPIALILHGTGSNPDFVRRTFLEAASDRGMCLATYRLRGHGPHPMPGRYDLPAHLADLAAVVTHLKPAVVGGISLGAHIAATWAAQPQCPSYVRGLALALPAWMGPPDVVAGANAHQAREIERIGVSACLQRLATDLADGPAEWVSQEMAATWPEHDTMTFCAVLDAVAASRAPDEQTLGRIAIPAGVVAILDDPLHPVAIARRWSAAIPTSRCSELTLDELGRDRSLLGHGAFAGLDLSEFP